jgi:hypothetical protein
MIVDVKRHWSASKRIGQTGAHEIKVEALKSVCARALFCNSPERHQSVALESLPYN